LLYCYLINITVTNVHLATESSATRPFLLHTPLILQFLLSILITLQIHKQALKYERCDFVNSE
jgi:hypothetical protein